MVLRGKEKRVVKWQLFKVIRILFEKSIYFAHTDAHISWLIFRCVRISGWISTIYKRFGQATESFQGWSGVCLIQTTSIKKGSQITKWCVTTRRHSYMLAKVTSNADRRRLWASSIEIPSCPSSFQQRIIFPNCPHDITLLYISMGFQC